MHIFTPVIRRRLPPPPMIFLMASDAAGEGVDSSLAAAAPAVRTRHTSCLGDVAWRKETIHAVL